MCAAKLAKKYNIANDIIATVVFNIHAGGAHREIISPPIPLFGNSMVEHNQCFLPAVILWSPFVVYSHILDAWSI